MIKKLSSLLIVSHLFTLDLWANPAHKPQALLQPQLLQPQLLQPEVLETQPHDPELFTQGLVFDGNTLYESSGLYKKSLLLRYQKQTRQQRDIDDYFFAEGITILKNRIYMLTWKAGRLLIFDKETMDQEDSLAYKGEGWGLTHNGQQLIMSNGSNQLFFRNPVDFSVEKTLLVKGLDKLNELEYVGGVIWANRWFDNRIYAIDAISGCIRGKIDLKDLRKQAVDSFHSFSKNVANGIAYEPGKNRLLVTGKYWSKQFFIRLPTLPPC